MMPPPTHDSLLAKIQRRLAPVFGYCGRCGRPWNRVKPHPTPYDATRELFPLCEGCWSRLTVDERLPYYRALHADWPRGYADWANIEHAVLAGL